jgi:alpha-tubulin suppressor-like RCC1 family protein
MVSSGTDHSLAILNDGHLVSWGHGDYGKLGINSYDANSLIPVFPLFQASAGSAIENNVVFASAGAFQSAVITRDGKYWAAGSRANGGLGNGNLGDDRERMLKVVSENMVSVAAGTNYILAIKNDGSLWGAGTNNDGRLGMGTIPSVDITKELTQNTNAGNDNAMVFTGKVNHTMLLKKSGKLFAAGRNSYGQLGVGKTDNAVYSSFTVVIDSEDKIMSDVAFVSLGESHSMILKNDGTLWAVGNNTDNRLGIRGGSVNKAIRVLDNVAYVASGYNHTMAVTSDGRVWGAGSNSNGQFGGIPLDPNGNGQWAEIELSSLPK